MQWVLLFGYNYIINQNILYYIGYGRNIAEYYLPPHPTLNRGTPHKFMGVPFSVQRLIPENNRILIEFKNRNSIY